MHPKGYKPSRQTLTQTKQSSKLYLVITLRYMLATRIDFTQTHTHLPLKKVFLKTQ